MESYPQGTIPQALNLFENEEVSLKNLRNLIFTPVGYNAANQIDPWDPTLLQMKSGFPEWFYKYFLGYNCIQRLIILVQRNRYLKSGRNEQYELVQIGGTKIIDLKQNIEYLAKNPSSTRQIIFPKDEKKDAKVFRPNSSRRFVSDNFHYQSKQSEADILNLPAKQIYRGTLGQTFYTQNEFHPQSMKQIFDGLMSEVRLELSSLDIEQTPEQIEEAISNHSQAWKFIFTSLGLDVNNQNEIDTFNEFFSNPSSILKKSIFFMYSMETFLPYNINKAERNQDVSKAQLLGPFARLLSPWKHYTKMASKKDKLTPLAFVYQGAKVPLKSFQEYKNIKKSNGLLKLITHTSTSFQKDIALKSLFKGLSNDEVPVLYQIKMLDEFYMQYFKLENSDYSVFPNEQEVFLEYGLTFKINEITQKERSGFKYQLVQLTTQCE